MDRLRAALGIRLIDVFATIVVALVVDLSVTFGGGAGARPLNALAYVLGAALALPVLLRRKWPLQVLIACSALLFLYYTVHRRNISPAPLLSLPLYDAALAGYLAVSIVIPAAFMATGLIVVGASSHAGIASLINEFLPSVVVLVLAIMLGETVRSRRALAAETADKLRLAAEEREAETARRLAEERLRIARELHDTVAHSMATITVQAGSALHLVSDGADGKVTSALAAIRDTSKGALADIRVTLGQLRAGDGQAGAGQPGQAGTAMGTDPPGIQVGGLARLSALTDAVQAAGAPVSVLIEGDQVPLEPGVDHAAYRILQESLTNVLRHAGPQATASIKLSYRPGALTIDVTDTGSGSGSGTAPDDPASRGQGDRGQGGHGLTGMAERAAAVGGAFRAGPRPGGGFAVWARLPVSPQASQGPPSAAAPQPSPAPPSPTAPRPA